MAKPPVATTPASEPPAPIKLPRTSESDQLKRIRHTASHVMVKLASLGFNVKLNLRRQTK